MPRLLGAALVVAFVGPLGCANIIGLDKFEAVEEDSGEDDNDDDDDDGASTGGRTGSGGTDGGSGGSEPSTGGSPSSGGSPASGGSPGSGGSCVDDNDLILMDADTLNGSFEETTIVLGDPAATGWTEEGYYDDATGNDYELTILTVDCTTAPCPTGILANKGDRAGWLGPFTDADPETPDTDPDDEDPNWWTDKLTSPVFTLPAAATSLRFLADLYIYTEDSEDEPYDYYYFTLVDAEGNEQLIGSGDQRDAYTLGDDWTDDGFDQVWSVQPDWAGKEVQLVISTENDSSLTTSFMMDDIRITATVDCD